LPLCEEVRRGFRYLAFIADDPEGRLIRNALTELGVEYGATLTTAVRRTVRCVLDEGDRRFVGDGWEEGKEHRPLRLERRGPGLSGNLDLNPLRCYAEMEDEMRKWRISSCVRTFDFSWERKFRTDEYLSKVCPSVDVRPVFREKLDEGQIDACRKRCGHSGRLCPHNTARKVRRCLTAKGPQGDREADHAGRYHGAGDSFFTSLCRLG
jgi:hypothetical protein